MERHAHTTIRAKLQRLIELDYLEDCRLVALDEDRRGGLQCSSPTRGRQVWL